MMLRPALAALTDHLYDQDQRARRALRYVYGVTGLRRDPESLLKADLPESGISFATAVVASVARLRQCLGSLPTGQREAAAEIAALAAGLGEASYRLAAELDGTWERHEAHTRVKAGGSAGGILSGATRREWHVRALSIAVAAREKRPWMSQEAVAKELGDHIARGERTLIEFVRTKERSGELPPRAPDKR